MSVEEIQVTITDLGQKMIVHSISLYKIFFTLVSSFARVMKRRNNSQPDVTAVTG
jgi:hypothetical protein